MMRMMYDNDVAEQKDSTRDKVVNISMPIFVESDGVVDTEEQYLQGLLPQQTYCSTKRHPGGLLG